MNMDKYLEERVDDQIQWYDKKSQSSQKWYKRLQVIEIVLASFIPLLSAYSTTSKQIAIIVGIFGAIIAIIESVSKLYKYHENWIQYRTTCEMLKFQKYLYLTGSSPYNNEKETIDNLFIRNIENIVSSENNQWKSINRDKEAANTTS